MQWKLINCLLLAAIALASANDRPKRSIGYIKNLIGTTLFGSATKVVYARLLARNDTHQLFSIPGQNYNILIQTANNTKSDKEDKDKDDKEKDKIRIVTPEIAILGTYLGTKTESETLLAIEMAKSLIKSGLVRDNLLQKVVIESKEKVTQPLNIYTEERNPVFIYPPERTCGSCSVNPPVAVYPVEVPPLVIAPEVAIRPVQTKYSYKQAGHDADMKYESYNGKDVIVTRTTKEPPIPEFIKIRIQEVAANGGIPFMRLPVAAEAVPQFNNVPIPYLYTKPAIVTPEIVSTVPNPALNVHIDSNPILFSQPIPLRDAVKILPPNIRHINSANVQVNNHALSNVKSESSSVKVQGSVETVLKDNSNDRKQTVLDILRDHSVNGQIVSKYSYKQINHNNPSQPYTEVKVESPPKVNPQEIEVPKITPSKDFVYVPPKNVNVPSPVGLSSHSIETSTIAANQFESGHIYTSKTIPIVPQAPKIIYKTSQRESLKSNPIVVAENKEGDAVIDVNNYDNRIDDLRRGDIPGSMH